MNDEYNKRVIEIGRKIEPDDRRFDEYYSKKVDTSKRKSRVKAVSNVAENVNETFNFAKRRLVSRLYWGRGNYYKNLTHVIMISMTLIAALTGIALRFNVQAENSLSSSDTILGTDDLLQQGGSIETVLPQEVSASAVGLNIRTQKYIVEEGETLQSIAEEYDISADTIRWASEDVPELFFSDRVQAGWELTIPDIDGVLHKVQPGETIDKIIAQTYSANDEANRFNIIEFNNLQPPYDLISGQDIFIPDGNLRRIGPEGTIDEIPRGIFSDPLSHPECNGYALSRGFTDYHNGLDLAWWKGCPISSVANGVVEYAGWASAGQGYMVRIDHGGGIKTEYFHGNGEYWVRTGDRVTQGQQIMGMGSTGYSTGTHLHIILWKDGYAVDPDPYIPHN